MKMLIAVEDKVFGKALADFVLSHQWKENPEFKIVNVVEPIKHLGPPLAGVSDTRFMDVIEERKRMGKSLVLSLGTSLRQSFPLAMIDELVVEGDPKSKILDLAQEWEADMVVMGSHGRRWLERLFLGSVSLAVLSHAPCSVIIVKLPDDKAKSEVDSQLAAKKDKTKVSAK